MYYHAYKRIAQSNKKKITLLHTTTLCLHHTLLWSLFFRAVKNAELTEIVEVVIVMKIASETYRVCPTFDFKCIRIFLTLPLCLSERSILIQRFNRWAKLINNCRYDWIWKKHEYESMMLNTFLCKHYIKHCITADFVQRRSTFSLSVHFWQTYR